MRQDVQNENALRRVVNPGDQSVAVAVNLEYRSSPDNVRMGEVSPHVRQRVPLGTLRDSIPVHQRRKRIPVLIGKVDDGRFADYAHEVSLRNVNNVSIRVPGPGCQGRAALGLLLSGRLASGRVRILSLPS